MGSGVANPAFVPMSKAFNQSITQTSYELTVYVLFSGVGPLFIAPLSNVYGRRPIHLVGNALAGITNVIAGYTDNWHTLLITRVFNGLGAGSAVAIGGKYL
jgi:MFS family permease